MNPLDMTGPEFLAFYVPYGLIVLLFARVARALMVRTSPPPEDARWAPGSYPQEGDAYAIALLRAGIPEAVRTLLSRLAGLGWIRIDGQKVRALSSSNAERQLQPMELAAWRAVGQGAPVNITQAQALVEQAVRPQLQEIQRELGEQGLAPGPKRRSALQMLRFVTWLAVVGLGLAKLWVALDRGRSNVGFLIVLLVVFWVTTLAALKPPLRTSAGAGYLKWLRESHRELIQRLETSRPNSSGEYALATGIYGLAGLTTIPVLAALDSAYRPRHTGDSSGSGGDSGSSSDGGGGDSGGGGCGGCGGGGGD